MALAEKRRTVTIEDAEIRFRNFAGKEGQYNREGDRNFVVFLPPAVAADMEKDGWNIKFLQPREEGDDPQAYVQVSVKFDGPRPPQVVMITSRGRTELTEDEVNILDWADIRNADLILSPYEWVVNDKSGIKAYLHKLFVTIEEDELDLKYQDTVDSAQNCIGPDCEIT